MSWLSVYPHACQQCGLMFVLPPSSSSSLSSLSIEQLPSGETAGQNNLPMALVSSHSLWGPLTDIPSSVASFAPPLHPFSFQWPLPPLSPSQRLKACLWTAWGPSSAGTTIGSQYSTAHALQQPVLWPACLSHDSRRASWTAWRPISSGHTIRSASMLFI